MLIRYQGTPEPKSDQKKEKEVKSSSKKNKKDEEKEDSSKDKKEEKEASTEKSDKENQGPKKQEKANEKKPRVSFEGPRFDTSRADQHRRPRKSRKPSPSRAKEHARVRGKQRSVRLMTTKRRNPRRARRRRNDSINRGALRWAKPCLRGCAIMVASCFAFLSTVHTVCSAYVLLRLLSQSMKNQLFRVRLVSFSLSPSPFFSSILYTPSICNANKAVDERTC